MNVKVSRWELPLPGGNSHHSFDFLTRIKSGFGYECEGDPKKGGVEQREAGIVMKKGSSGAVEVM